MNLLKRINDEFVQFMCPELAEAIMDANNTLKEADEYIKKCKQERGR